MSQIVFLQVGNPTSTRMWQLHIGAQLHQIYICCPNLQRILVAKNVTFWLEKILPSLLVRQMYSRRQSVPHRQDQDLVWAFPDVTRPDRLSNMHSKIMEEAREPASEDSSVLNLGCLFLFSGICFFGPQKPVRARIPEDFFFSVFFGGISSQGCGFGGVLKILFSSAFTGVFHRNSCRTEIPVFAQDSSRFLQISPDSCSRQKLSGLVQRIKKALC